jgi:hypothetical protein
MSPLEKAELHITEARRRAEGYEAMLDVARRHGLSDEVERLEGLAEAADFAADSWEDQRQRLVDGEPPEPSHPGDDDGLFDEQ